MSWETVAREHDMVAKTGDPDFWQQYLAERPDVMHRLLADLYQAANAHRPDARPTIEELQKLVTQQFSNEPFGEAVKVLMEGRSVRWLAKQMHIHHSLLVRILSGERDIVSIRDPRGSMVRIEAIARALRVHPAYFQEYRRLWIMSLLDSAFAAQPNLSIGVWKKFSGATQSGGPR